MNWNKLLYLRWSVLIAGRPFFLSDGLGTQFRKRRMPVLGMPKVDTVSNRANALMGTASWPGGTSQSEFRFTGSSFNSNYSVHTFEFSDGSPTRLIAI
jgi:hypothetical protein